MCQKGLRRNRHEIYTATCQSLQPTFYTEVKRVVLHGENCQKAHFMWTPLLTAGLLSWMRTWLPALQSMLLRLRTGGPQSCLVFKGQMLAHIHRCRLRTEHSVWWSGGVFSIIVQIYAAGLALKFLRLRPNLWAQRSHRYEAVGMRWFS